MRGKTRRKHMQRSLRANCESQVMVEKGGELLMGRCLNLNERMFAIAIDGDGIEKGDQVRFRIPNFVGWDSFSAQGRVYRVEKVRSSVNNKVSSVVVIQMTRVNRQNCRLLRQFINNDMVELSA